MWGIIELCRSQLRAVPAAAAALALTLVPPVAAQLPGSPPPAEPPPAAPRVAIAGRVVTPFGDPVADAVVTVVELRRRQQVGADGGFRVEDVPPATYLLSIESARFGTAVERVAAAAGEVVEVTIELDVAVHQESIVVTGGPEARRLADTYQPADVLSDSELQSRMEMTLGETLAQQPGVSSSYFGPGASRPVIRGLGGDRIRVLEGGIGSGDASSTSPDHAVATNPLTAERIEIVRGPATLLYGSSAIGGVINVLDGRIPDFVPEEPVTGEVQVRAGSAADERSGFAALDGGRDRLAWHLDLMRRETGDYEIPGPPEADHESEAAPGEDHEEEEPFRGILENSAVEAEGASLGLSWVREDAFIGLAVTGYDSLYGVPGHGHAHEGEEGEGQAEEEEAEEAPVRVDLEQRRLDLKGEVNRPFGIFRGVKLRFGGSDYEHAELEGPEVGTRFTNEAWEGRIEAPHRALGSWTGAVGAQVARRDFAAIGEEAFVPPTETESWALFAFEELARGSWKLQLGGRYEDQEVAARAVGGARSLAGVSGSAGVVWLAAEGTSLALSVARSVKLPNAEELFSNGPHLATNAFEIGDPGLDEETSLGADLSLRRTAGRLSGEVSVFLNRFDDYIYEEPAGEVQDGLPVFRFVQRDAEFWGAELHGDLSLLHREPHHLDLELMADLVRAELAGGEPLPRIPPVRFGLGVHYRGEQLWGRVEGRRVTAQERVAPFEEPTSAFTMLDAALGYRFFASDMVHELVLAGSNLTDELARNHVSFLKERAPLPGRDVSLSYRLQF